MRWPTRDIFLDHEATEAFVRKQLKALKSLAKRRGWAIAIGHPYPETLAVLSHELPKLRAAGFDLVTLSELIARGVAQKTRAEKRD